MSPTREDEAFLVAAIEHYKLFIGALERANAEEQRTARIVFRGQQFHAEKFLERVRASRSKQQSVGGVPNQGAP